MDKTWMCADRRSKKYQLGVSKFLQFALENARNVDLLCCPCLDCGNTKSFSISIIHEHLYFHGFDSSYQNWIWHGEAARLDDPELTETDLEATLISDEGDGEANVDIVGDMDSDVDFTGDEEFSKDSDEFREFVEDGCKPMYPGCTKFTKLNALVRMYNLKAKNSMTDVCFEDMLIMVADFLPEGNELPTSCYEAKKILGNLGMNYRKIHACPNDCILYRNEYANNSSCPTCLASRWQLTKDKKKIKEGTPAKVMWYFPLIPRFRRMFQSPKISEDLKWHSGRNVTEGIMRHPADSPAWKLVDNKWPDFSNDIRNLRIALSTDGFNPHGSMSSRYSCWPVVIIIYNLPPWLTMKRKFMMLNTIISGPKQPGNNIDVYLQVIVDELKILWS